MLKINTIGLADGIYFIYLQKKTTHYETPMD